MKSKVFFAEMIGTFALVFIGAGAGAVGSGGLIGVALAHGLVIATFVYLYGEISGAHFNPAVTFGLALNGTVEWGKAVFYWIAQLLGATIAAGLLFLVLGGADSGLGATLPASSINVFQAVIIEAILTFFLANAVLFGAVEGLAGKRAGFVIGLTLVFAILMGGPLTGASLNPARTFGPAIFTGNFDTLWIYLLGPLAGAGLATGVYRLLKNKK